MRITELTRRDIVDSIGIEKINWSGRMDEPTFLSRLFDLGALPSTDRRFSDAATDIWQHRVNNNDGDDDWVFYDSRFNVLKGTDETFLAFLCETIHPAVRPDTDEAERICQIYNNSLSSDGFKLVEKTKISGKPVYIGQYVGLGSVPHIASAKAVLIGTDPVYVAQQIARMENAVQNDPALAIGTAKELVETCCKTILSTRSIEFSKSADLPELMKLTIKELALSPDDVPEKAKAAEIIKKLLNNLATITQGVAELRNHYGTGHGKTAGSKGLGPRHAKLAVGAAATLAVFLAETHNEKL